MNTREFIESIREGAFSDVDICKYLKEVDAMAMQDLYDRVYIASLASMGEGGSDNLFRASSTIAKYAKVKCGLNVGYGEPDEIEPQPYNDGNATTLPDELSSDEAKEYFTKAIEYGLMNESYVWKATQRDLSYFAAKMSDKLKLTDRLVQNIITEKEELAKSWRPFETLFKLKEGTLRGEYSKIRTGSKELPKRSDIIDRIFD